MKKSLSFMVVLVVAFGLGGCAKSYITPPKEARYDESKSYAYNVVHSTTTYELASVDTPGGGLTKPYKGMKDSDIRKIARSEALSAETVPSGTARGGAAYSDAALDMGIGAVYNSLTVPGWANSGAGSGGLNNVETLGITAGLLLLNSMTQDHNSLLDHDVYIFGWVPREDMTKEEAKEWFAAQLLRAYTKALKNHAMQEPYTVREIKNYSEPYYSPVWAEVEGSWCDLEEVSCRVGTMRNIEMVASKMPAFIESKAKDAWQIMAWGVSPVDDSSLKKKPKGYEKPKMELFSILQETSKHLPENMFILVPGKSKYGEVLAFNGKGGLASLGRPLLLNKGLVHSFTTPPEEVAQLKREAEKKKFLGMF